MSGQGTPLGHHDHTDSKMESGHGANEQVESGFPLPGAENRSGVTSRTSCMKIDFKGEKKGVGNVPFSLGMKGDEF